MESASKRKAAGGAGVENEGRPMKRQKLPADDLGTGETVETTRAQGLKFLECLKQAKDKTGRPIADHFLTLPDKDIPGYYDVIKLPIAIDTIEAKLHAGEYSNLAQVESDQKRMVNNAKAFNDKKSLVYEDAERLRKTASNWMVKHNPAYRTQGYTAQPTPLPGEEPISHAKTPRALPLTPRNAAAPIPESTTERPRRAAATAAVAAVQSMTPAPSKLRHSASVAPDEDENPGFEGKTFQQAQDQIIRELIDYVEPESGLQIFLPFVQLPSRSLKDYYQLIKDPVSLNAVQKKVRGIIGRSAPTGITELKSWDAFEQMTSMIWKNARDYNEDGSELYNVSIELEEMFKKRLAEAKAKVPEPPQPKLKLNMSVAAPSQSPAAPKQQLKLKLRQSPASDPNTPRARSSATPGFIVDNEALLRQQKHVMESMNGTRNSRAGSAGKSSTPVPATPFTGARAAGSSISLPVAHGKTAGSPPAMNGIKNDVQSPALNAIRPASTSDTPSQRPAPNAPAQTPMPAMAPPQHLTRPMSGSPHPNGPLGQQTPYASQYQPPPPSYYVPPVVPHFENFRKVPLKSVDEALIPKITLNTHPVISLPKPWKISIPANKQKTNHSVTINIPHNYAYMQVVPYIPIALTNRAYRLFVTVNGIKNLEVNRVPVTAGINGNAGLPGLDNGGKKKGEPLFEAKLGQGVNRIEVEIVAEKDRKGKAVGVESKDPKDLVEVEKCTIFVHLTQIS